MLLAAAAITALPVEAQAYVGPGAGLTAIGTMIAFGAAVVLALVGFVWYPMKRLMKGRSDARNAQSSAIGSQERGE
ncbi:hypothetical protein GCM10011315_35020 [Roseovarius pacificus]|nr:hypothetical protein GCM10011315_35020 [Roseovarius pacificus]